MRVYLKKSLLEKGYKAEAIKLDITKIDEVIDTIKKVVEITTKEANKVIDFLVVAIW